MIACQISGVFSTTKSPVVSKLTKNRIIVHVLGESHYNGANLCPNAKTSTRKRIIRCRLRHRPRLLLNQYRLTLLTTRHPIPTIHPEAAAKLNDSRRRIGDSGCRVACRVPLAGSFPPLPSTRAGRTRG